MREHDAGILIMHTFTVLDSSNSARVTLSDPRQRNWHTRDIITLADNRAIANSIAQYARERKIPLEMVQYSITWPEVQL